MQIDSDIAVIVVTYMSQATIDECLLRIRAAEHVSQIRVVDNGSTDDTVSIIQRHAAQDKRIFFIANPDNPGFSTACNQGARESQSTWLAFVNPDCMLDANVFRRMLNDWTETQREVLMGVELIDQHGQVDPASRRRDPTFAAILFDRAARDITVPKNEHEQLQCVDAVSGAFMLMRRTLFSNIGGFDEGYRLHAEDLDLCRRVRACDADVMIANSVQVVHWRGVSSRARPYFVEWNKHKGLWRYFQKFEAQSTPLHLRALVKLSLAVHLMLTFLKKLMS